MPKITRRRFLQVSGVAIAAAAGSKIPSQAMELEKGGKSINYARLAVGRKESAFTVSPFSKLKSPQQVFLEDGKVVANNGFLNHPVTAGRSSALDALSHMVASDADRLTAPLRRTGKRGENKWKKITWDEALSELSQKIGAAISGNGPGSLWLVRGEDTQDGVLARFMNTLGSGSVVSTNGDGNKKSGQTFTWGEDTEMPDFSKSRFILNFGSNIFETFPSHAKAVAEGRADKHAKLITFDPRMSMTAGLSDEWIPVVPGTDGLVALAMSNVIMQEGLADKAFINSYTNITADSLAKHLSQFTLEMAEKESGIKADVIKRIAIEFASAKPATVFAYRGASSHTNGTDTERAIMLLPVITGNVEIEGGYCLPRRIRWDSISPAPLAAKPSDINGAAFPFAVKNGSAKVGVLVNHNSNPAYSAAASSYWRDVYMDERLVPFSVGICSLVSETASLCDMLLPEAVYLESNEPVSSPAIFPWVAVRTPISKAPGDVRELKIILRDIIRAVDNDGSKGYKKFWEFEDPEEWMTKYFENIPGLKDDGGLGALKDNGPWPVYGSLDIKTGKVLDGDGKQLKAAYGLHKKGGFATPSKKIEVHSSAMSKKGLEPLPTWKKAANLTPEKEEGKEELVFISYKTAYRAGSAAANNKYLAEKDHYNHCLINKETAKELGIKDGDLIRVASPAGYLVTKARATQTIHPKVIAMAGGFGHKSGGRVAQLDKHDRPMWAQGDDADIHYNMWWEDNGVNPNDIIPYFRDPASGAASLSFIAKVEKAKAGDVYGDVKTDVNIHETFYKKATEQVKG